MASIFLLCVMISGGEASPSLPLGVEILYQAPPGTRVVSSGSSKDLLHWYLVVETEDAKYFVVQDGKNGPEYDWVGTPVFSPSGAHLAYWANKGGVPGDEIAPGGVKWLVVLDGKEGLEYDWVGDISFTEDGSKMGYLARDGNKVFRVVEDVEDPR